MTRVEPRARVEVVVQHMRRLAEGSGSLEGREDTAGCSCHVQQEALARVHSQVFLVGHCHCVVSHHLVHDRRCT